MNPRNPPSDHGVSRRVP